MKRLIEDAQSGGTCLPKKHNGRVTRNREVATVLVKNLPKSYNQSRTRAYFEECGNIIHVDVVTVLKQQSRYARIEFSTHEEALRALTKSYKTVGQNEITVTLLENCTVWITNFPPIYTKREIKELFIGIGKTVLSVRLPSLRFNSKRRFAYVDLVSTEDATTAVTVLNEKKVDSYTLVAKLSNPADRSKRTDSALLEKREVIIRNLKGDITEQQLRDIFEGKCTIEKVTVHDTNDKSSKYAFIIFSQPEEAQEAIKLNKSVVNGNLLHVSIADKKMYLDRQKVKRILNSKKFLNNDKCISLFPLSDTVSTAQIEGLLTEKLSITPESIQEMHLVTDHEGALVIFTDTKTAAKASLALHKIKFMNKILHCGNVRDLKFHTKVMK